MGGSKRTATSDAWMLTGAAACRQCTAGCRKEGRRHADVPAAACGRTQVGWKARKIREASPEAEVRTEESDVRDQSRARLPLLLPNW